MIVQAFSAMPNKRLVVIGEGPEYEKCRAVAGPNVQLLGWQSFEVLKSHMQRARAFVFAAEEDFGITPLEAQACGTPVIAFGKGAVLETIRGLDQSAPTGLFFDKQTPESVIDAVQRFEADSHLITPQACRENALRFDPARFQAEFTSFVDEHWVAFNS
jgi:glycosyltransferase involved in cell wall biosynthesis